MTDDSAFKNQVRARMAETGEKYTVARRLWRRSAAEELHDELEELTGRRVRLDITARAADFRR